MSDHAGIVCSAGDVKKALAGARALNASIRKRGLAYEGAYEARRALQWRQMAIVSEAVLAALAYYVGRGGGSRGARAVCSPEGECVPLARTGPLGDFRFLPSGPKTEPSRFCPLRGRIISLFGPGRCALTTVNGARSSSGTGRTF